MENKINIGVLTFLFSFMCCPLHIQSQSMNDSLIHVLNKELENSHSYYVKKENRITLLKQSLVEAHNRQRQSEVIEQLFNEYISYQYDSAYHYACQCVELARHNRDKSYTVKAQINLLHCYVASGLFKEAYQQLTSIDISDANPALKVQYYSLGMRLYTNMMLNESNPFYDEYAAKGLAYSDSIRMNLNAGTQEYAYYELLNYNLSEKECRDRITNYERMLDSHTFSGPEYATIYIYLGVDYDRIGDTERAIHYALLSTLYDIRNSIRQTTAKTYLGEYLYKEGEIMLASKCIRAALEDANFYNAQHRKIHVNSVLPIIEAEKINIIESQKDKLALFLKVFCVLVFILVCSVVTIYIQFKKIKRARQETLEHFNEICRINEILKETNEKLRLSGIKLEESNEIKDMYITQSLYAKSEYIDRFENLVKLVDRKVQAKQYQDLGKLYQEFNLKRERENMFSTFDKAFLLLFPHFIADYNRLFSPENQVTPEEEEGLTPELRIFALMRLGIGENERIAKFLNLSVKTVYSYRYKARTRSIVPKEEFEYQIMKIQKGVVGQA